MDTDEEIRRHVIDRVIDLGGEVFGVTVYHGVVRLHGRVGMREDVPVIERLLQEVEGVTGIETLFLIGGREPEREPGKPVAPADHSELTRG